MTIQTPLVRDPRSGSFGFAEVPVLVVGGVEGSFVVGVGSVEADGPGSCGEVDTSGGYPPSAPTMRSVARVES